MNTTTDETVITVPEGTISGGEITPRKELTAVFTGPDGTELTVRVSLFQAGAVFGVGVYPTSVTGAVLRWLVMSPEGEPDVIHWHAPQSPDDECG
jgi:hypothetical protein